MAGEPEVGLDAVSVPKSGAGASSAIHLAVTIAARKIRLGPMFTRNNSHWFPVLLKKFRPGRFLSRKKSGDRNARPGYTVTFRNTYPASTTTTAVKMSSSRIGIAGIPPVPTSRIASMAKLSGLTRAIAASQPGMAS